MRQGQLKRMVQNTVPTRTGAYRRYRTCDRKKVYPDMETGWRSVRYIQSLGKDLYPDFELRPYVCDFCGKIHVGHSNMPKSSEARLRGDHELAQKIAQRTAKQLSAAQGADVDGLRAPLSPY